MLLAQSDKAATDIFPIHRKRDSNGLIHPTTRRSINVIISREEYEDKSKKTARKRSHP